MKLLLDTHTFIWWVSDPTKLSDIALGMCHDPMNTLSVSVASIWEIQIKNQIGKLQLSMPLGQIIANQQINRLEVVPINLEHILALYTLPMHHKYPFDRLIIAQANIEDAVLLSQDPVFKHYPVNVQW